VHTEYAEDDVSEAAKLHRHFMKTLQALIDYRKISVGMFDLHRTRDLTRIADKLLLSDDFVKELERYREEQSKLLTWNGYAWCRSPWPHN
jgi:hypothetical protein